jgi:hypothetical protein
MRVYCDTCIYIDALGLGRQGDKLRPLSDLAWGFFTSVSRGQYTLVISDWVFDEFRNVVGSDKELVAFLQPFDKRIHVTRDKDDESKARKLSSNYPDALHVVLALKANAVILTTRNLEHFAEFQNLIRISLPENL